jgi:hypothetical protein
LSRTYFDRLATASKSLPLHLKSWWATTSLFDKRWTIALAVLSGISVLGLLIYSSSTRELQAYLSSGGFPPSEAQLIASFSIKEFCWYIVFLLISTALLILIGSGFFAGEKAKFAIVALGLVLVSDLVRANQPWILFYNYKEKYASNPIVELLRDKPYEHRVTVLPFAIPDLQNVQQVYGIYWMQHTFPYYNIQSLDVVQEPRLPEEKVAFQGALGNSLLKYWQLTNTRFFLGLVGIIDGLNQQLDPERHRFRLHTAFTMHQERANGPITVETNTTGPYALIEFTGALPRAKLYSQWEVDTNSESILKKIAAPTFDPETNVIVSQDIPSATESTSFNAAAGTVQISDYTPKRIELKSDASRPTVLLLNDRYDPDWKVTVDGKPESLFRANYIMRGVYLSAGAHSIKLRFTPSNAPLCITLTAMGFGVVLVLLVIIEGKRSAPTESPE